MTLVRTDIDLNLITLQDSACVLLDRMCAVGREVAA